MQNLSRQCTLPGLLELTKTLLSRALEQGGPAPMALDATLGNGHDTLFLAQAVGDGGHVYGFDVQPGAVEATRQRLGEAGLEHRATLFTAGHECMAELLPDHVRGKLAAAVFNLGFLPGSDKRVITRPETTLEAIHQAMSFLTPGGVICVHAYGGHPGGTRELSQVEAFVSGLSSEEWRCLVVREPGGSEALFALEKRRGR